MLFHDQPRVGVLVAMAQERLAGLSGLDMVPMRWLHLTTYIVGFVDEIADGGIEAMVVEGHRLFAGIPPIPVNLGCVLLPGCRSRRGTARRTQPGPRSCPGSYRLRRMRRAQRGSRLRRSTAELAQVSAKERLVWRLQHLSR
jgi:hypothetical protein